MGKPVLLLIRDGWGIAPDYPGNAVAAANTPNMDHLLAEYPWCTLDAAGEAVGVRQGSQGSSEVGHLNMGAGRIVEQEVVRVDKLIRSGEMWENDKLHSAVARCKETGKAFHLMGLVQDQGVHATQEHLFAFIKHLAKAGIQTIYIHFFGDGRDTPPQSALTYLDQLEAVCAEAGAGKVATVQGRYWAMDRGENWDRTQKAYRLLTAGEGLKASSAREAIEQAYERSKKQRADGDDLVETDEFIMPTAIVGDDGEPIGTIQAGDVVLHTNYRQDRAIQLTKAFVEDDFTEFDRGPTMDIVFLALTRYYNELDCELVPPMNMAKLLGEVLAEHGKWQLRIAEYQKYRHVTSFFNGKSLTPFPGQDNIEVESISIPEDQKPEMSAYEVTELVTTAVTNGIEAVRRAAADGETSALESRDFGAGGSDDLGDTYDAIMLNFANGDMVGHTGVFDAALKAIEAVDDCLGKVVDAVLARDGVVLVTADHGNAEEMTKRDSDDVQTSHTLNPVHFVLVARDAKDRFKLREHGKLSDIAPTMLKLLGIDVPAEMTADCLIAD
ncbi:MAG: 2,3-bisphosphoglycerate-independent phosphoglycerate mutase [Planctomycetes bacterium]|jgi:2,3-bisphosphoglycerate-independent phosphoglycerate mutase|nr:2,3-bisphosphoglycerate-independent phosphoglycerate mutase [Planctomycetota bacterium]